MKKLLRLIAAALPFVAGAAEIEVDWLHVPKALVEGRKVDVQLAGGGSVSGRALAVLPEGLRLERVMVDRAEIAALKCRRRHVRWRITGAVTGGALGGLYSGMSVWTSSGGEDLGPKLAAASIGAVAGGNVLGWMLDRRAAVTVIRIRH